MKKIIATMIGIAFAFCCFMLLDGCNSTEVENSEETANQVVTYDDVIWADIEDCYWDYDYASYSITEYPSEENDGMLKYNTYDTDGNVLTMNSVHYDWAVGYYFGCY